MVLLIASSLRGGVRHVVACDAVEPSSSSLLAMARARWASFGGMVLTHSLLGCPAEDTTSTGAGAGGTGGEAAATTGGMGAGGSGGAASGGGGTGGAGGSGGSGGGQPMPDPELCAKLEVPAMPMTGFATLEEAAASMLEPGIVYDIAVPASGPVYVAFSTVSEHTTFGAYVNAPSARLLRAGVEIAATTQLVGCDSDVFAKVTHHAHMPSVFVLEIERGDASSVIGMFEVL